MRAEELVDATIVLPDAPAPAEALAGDELKKYLSAVCKGKFRLCAEADAEPGSAIFVGKTRMAGESLGKLRVEAPQGEAYVVCVQDDGVVLCGARPRGTLYAVYHFLEELGFRFFEPGASGEVIPGGLSDSVENQCRIYKPDMPFRQLELMLSRRDGMDHQLEIISWAAKNRVGSVELNAFQDYGCDYVRIFPHLMKEAGKRDLDIVLGDHGILIYLLLPDEDARLGESPANWKEFVSAVRKRIRQHPDWFGLSSGDRADSFKDTSGFSMPCLSNPEVIEALAHGASRTFDIYPELCAIRLIQNDSGVPCPCGNCRSYRENKGLEWYLARVRPIAEKLKRDHPDKFIIQFVDGYPCDVWHEDFEEPLIDVHTRKCDLPDNLMWLIGLESYDYAYPINTPHNDRHWKRLTMLQEFLGERDDFILTKVMHGSGLYRGLLRVQPHRVVHDHRITREHIRNWRGTNVFVNNSSVWHVFAVDLYVHFRAVWDMDVDVSAVLSDYCEKRFGPEAAPRVLEALREIEQHGLDVVRFDPRSVGVLERYSTWADMRHTLEYSVQRLKKAEGSLDEAETLCDTGERKAALARLKEPFDVLLTSGEASVEFLASVELACQAHPRHWPFGEAERTQNERAYLKRLAAAERAFENLKSLNVPEELSANARSSLEQRLSYLKSLDPYGRGATGKET